MQDKAMEALLAYTQDFGAFLSSANKNLPKATVAELLKKHVEGLKGIIDAQKAKDWNKVFAGIRSAYGHSGEMGAAVVAGTAAKFADKFPDKFPGRIDGGAKLRAALNALLGEHVLLATMATNAAVGGRSDEFKAAAEALNGTGDTSNSTDVVKAIGSAYGADTQKAFDPLWRKHITFVVDYTNGLAKKDKAMQEKAVKDLLAYTEDFGAFLASANSNLTKEDVADLLKAHVNGLKDVIDAQSAKDYNSVYSKMRSAYGHSSEIADALGVATVKKFPKKFGP